MHSPLFFLKINALRIERRPETSLPAWRQALMCSQAAKAVYNHSLDPAPSIEPGRLMATPNERYS